MKRQIKSFVEVDEKDLVTAISDFITSKPDNEYLTEISCRLGWDNEGNAKMGVCFSTQIGVEPKPMPHPMC